MGVFKMEKGIAFTGASCSHLTRYLFLSLLIMLLTACSSNSGSDLPPISPDTSPPTVSFSPPPDQIDVLVGSPISIQFSEPVTKPVAKLDASDFGICEIVGGSPDCSITFSFEFDEANNLVILKPTTPLGVAKEYMVKANIYGTITDTSPAKNPMGGVASARFSTTKPPFVKATTPGNNPGPKSIISATFSEVMKLATINTGFTVNDSYGMAVPGTVSLSGDGLTATFLTSTDLVTGATYTATMSTGTTDLADNPLMVEQNWSFSLQSPTATILFPTPVSLTNATTLTVTGAASDEGNIMGISVNGVPATSTDGFATWRTQVGIVVGETRLLVRTEDVVGNVNTMAAEATVNNSGPAFGQPMGITLDIANNRNRALVADISLRALVAVDLSTGNRAIISDAGTGSGPAFIRPYSVTLDAANDRALVIDGDLGLLALVAVDLSTGNRTIISDAGTGSGPAFSQPIGVTLDIANNRVLVTDYSLRALVAVDLDTGIRTIVSDAKTGSGPDLVNPRGLTLDTANNRALVIDGVLGLRALVTVDLSSGNRAIISDASTGSGPAFSQPIGVTLDIANNRVLVTDYSLRALVAVDLDTGIRTMISDTNTGSGPIFGITNGVILDAANNRVLVADSGWRTLVAVDLTTNNLGNRTIFSDFRTGSGPIIYNPTGVTLDTNNNRALVTGFSGLLAVDFTTGNRTIVSNAMTGSGPTFSDPRGVILDAANNRALVIDSGFSTLVAVDLVTGNRTFISKGSIGSGPVFSNPRGITLDIANNRALVIDRSLLALVAVDLTTGNRTIVSDASMGIGPVFSVPVSVTLDTANKRALVIDRRLALVAVDLATGDRTIISDASTGSGTAFFSPYRVTMDAANKRALVIDLNFNVLVAVDLTTGNVGNRTVISDASTGNGPYLSYPKGITMDAANNQVLITDIGSKALIAVELTSGDRVIVSK